jgi:transketolase
VASEAASLAGQLELGKLIYLFDNNHVTLSAGTNIASNENCAQRFEAYGWHTQSLENGNDLDAIDHALRVAIETRDRPVALVLTRQDVPTLDRNHYASAEGLRRGAYILAEAANGRPEVILIATGSEVSLIVEARQQLQKQDIQTRLVSMPSWELFDAQTEECRRSLFPPSVRTRLAVETGATQGWHRYVGEWGDVIGLDHFGASAPGPVLMREYGFTAENVCKRALALLEKNNA